VYPPNSTVILNVTCDTNFNLSVLGEVTKLVIEYNRASIILGGFSGDVFTNEVVIKHNAGQLSLLNDMGSVEIQSNGGGGGGKYGVIDVYGSIRYHMDQKDNTAYSSLYFHG